MIGPLLKASYRRAHPVARMGFVARLLTYYPYAIFVYFLIPLPMLTVFSLSLMIFLWPLIDIVICGRTQRKNTVELNMSVDGCFIGTLFLLHPSETALFCLLLILTFNVCFIGGLKLQVQVFFVTFMVIYLGNPNWTMASLEPISVPLTIALLTHASLYVLLCSLRGHHLVLDFLRLNKKFTLLSFQDQLTGCHNRAYFNREAEKLLAQSSDKPLTFIFADIDHFKNINDQFGHAVGDYVLQEFAELVKSEIRGEEDFLARYGGEEFVIVLNGVDCHRGCGIAERIREEIEQATFEFDNVRVPVTCSFGVTTYESNLGEPDFAHLVKVADEGLYRAKALGRNRVQFKPLV